MNRTFMIAAAFGGIALAVAVVLFRREQHVTAISPAAMYAIPNEQIKPMIAKASAGDCEAAGALADYYMNVALDFDAALKWSRRGAACPGVFSKERLIILLGQIPPSDATIKEIDKSLDEIRQLDPVEADRLTESVRVQLRLMSEERGDHSSH